MLHPAAVKLVYGPNGAGSDLLRQTREVFLRGAGAWPSLLDRLPEMDLWVGVTCSGDGERRARTVVDAPLALAAGTCADSYGVQVRVLLRRVPIYEVVVAAHYKVGALGPERTVISYSHDTVRQQSRLLEFAHEIAEVNNVERGAAAVIEHMTDYYRLDRGDAPAELWRGA